jgi:hypothetical protein
MSLHLASKYVASTKVASHMTQLTSPTSFWHNVKDLLKLDFKFSFKNTFHFYSRSNLKFLYLNYHMDHINSGGPPTAHTKFLPTLDDFPVHLGTDTLSKVVQAKYERMKDQSY